MDCICTMLWQWEKKCDSSARGTLITSRILQNGELVNAIDDGNIKVKLVPSIPMKIGQKRALLALIAATGTTRILSGQIFQPCFISFHRSESATHLRA